MCTDILYDLVGTDSLDPDTWFASKKQSTLYTTTEQGLTFSYHYKSHASTQPVIYVNYTTMNMQGMVLITSWILAHPVRYSLKTCEPNF